MLCTLQHSTTKKKIPGVRNGGVQSRHKMCLHTILCFTVDPVPVAGTLNPLCCVLAASSDSEEEIIRIYGMRWDVGAFFKACKSLLRLGKEFRGRSYDMMVTHTTIVFTRYIMLS